MREEDEKTEQVCVKKENLGENGMPDETRGLSFHSSFLHCHPKSNKST